MTTKLKWRLGKLPSPDEVTLLLDKGVLTKDEAREILFSLETDEDRDQKSLQEEIKFLRELVKGMALPSRIVTEIRSVQVPYIQRPWWNQYDVYCNAVSQQSLGSLTYASSTGSGLTSSVYSLNSQSASGTGMAQQDMLYSVANTPEVSFTDIKTF